MNIFDFIRTYQLDLMLILSGICIAIAVFSFFTNAIPKKRKLSLILMALSAALLLLSDRTAYRYRGDVSRYGYYMVRISNFLVYIMTLSTLRGFNVYLTDLYQSEVNKKRPVKRLVLANWLALFGMAMVVYSQFTGLYYYFDEYNRYQRGPGFVICYIIPLFILFLQFSVIIPDYKKLRRRIRIPILLFTIVPMIASLIQLYAYGISLTNISTVGLVIILYLFVILDLNETIEKARKREIEVLQEEQQQQYELFKQTAEALANAIDAKDKYTIGHSNRVANYAKKIAEMAGLNDEEVEQVYFAGLLHDVGKIGVADRIINKDGKLTDEEYEEIKKHPVYGNQILSSIKQSPYLSVGAHYHHERYDGKGYPEGLSGQNIPRIARIIAVADSYDAMTSKRSYRDPIPQQKVREEIVKGMSSQFDPDFAKIMLHLIDVDTEYEMKEHEEGLDPSFTDKIHCKSIYHDCSSGILINDYKTRISFSFEEEADHHSEPYIILFDSLDGNVHHEDANEKQTLYYEYGQICFDGEVKNINMRKYELRSYWDHDYLESADEKIRRYTIEAFRKKDHLLIRMVYKADIKEYVIALPNATRFAYISLAGEHCYIGNITITTSVKNDEDDIPRIAEEINYLKDLPKGDIDNLQIDGWRSDESQAVEISDGMVVRFHSKSLPTARLIWHCPFISIFSSDDGCVGGKNYREYVLVRLDGENWESDKHAKNSVELIRSADFKGWDEWINQNKEGYDVEALITRKFNLVTVESEILGLKIISKTIILDNTEKLYLSLTGDQCVISGIYITRKA